ncbi:MAG: glycosyltransferase family 2 protein [Galbitalea sp.]
MIDSGSSDRSLEIVEARPWVRLHRIPNEEFGHGRTRNLGARLASGRLVAFLTQDAIPAHSHWLREITLPLDPDGWDAVAVVGRQVARSRCFPLLKYEIRGVFSALGPDGGVTVVSRTDDEPVGSVLDQLSFYSDVNSATRRDFLLDVIPYRDLPYSEDFAFARDLILAGHRKAYAPTADVVHSNDLTLREYRKRIFDEIVARRRVGEQLPPLGRGTQFLRVVYGIVSDSIKIVTDHDYGAAATVGWLFRNPWYHLAKWGATYRGTRVDLDDHRSIARQSLEHEITRKGTATGS